MFLYRICPTQYAKAIDGVGARINGGRWNHVGTACIYTSVSRALSLLEYSCHVSLAMMPISLSFVTYEVPIDSITDYTALQLPDGWKTDPYSIAAKDFGTAFLKSGKSLLCQLPSTVIEEEMNVLINPLHPAHAHVKIRDIRPYYYDVRIKT